MLTIMGILNATPDSFSDGGNFLNLSSAINHGLKLMTDGADIIDVGGVSTKPGAKKVPEQEEITRVIPVIKNLAKEGVSKISIDTKSALVAQMALDNGAIWINDQSAGLQDSNMAKVMQQAQAVVLMHSLNFESGVDAGELVHYNNIISEIRTFFINRIEVLKLPKNKIIIDPGIGFSKGLENSLEIIKNINKFNDLGHTLLGLSRKSFLGKLSGIVEPKDRDFVSLGASIASYLNGVNIVRTHNVLILKQFLRTFEACLNENLY